MSHYRDGRWVSDDPMQNDDSGYFAAERLKELARQEEAMTKIVLSNGKLYEKAKKMRDALDGIELALQGIEHLEELQSLWQDADDSLKIKVEMDIATFRQICTALEECNRIVNDEAYETRNLLSTD